MDEIPATPVLSSSSVNTYLRCGRQWEYAYVYAIKAPPRLRALIGLAAHEAVEVNYRQKISTGVDLPVEAVLDAFSDAFDREVNEIVPDKDETPGAGKDSGINTVRVYHTSVSPTIQPLLVEQNVKFKVNDIPFSGYIDVVDSHRKIRDLKTVKSRPSSNDYALNMTAYAIGFRQMTGETETGLQLDYMVRTKTPYYWPVPHDGPVPDTAINQFASIVTRVADGISKGSFPSNGIQSNACSWCGYRSVCPDAIKEG